MYPSINLSWFITRKTLPFTHLNLQVIPKYNSNFFQIFSLQTLVKLTNTIFSFHFNGTTKIIPVNISSHNASDTLSSWFWFRKWSVKKFTISSKLTSSISQPVSTFFRRIWLSRSWTLCKKKSYRLLSIDIYILVTFLDWLCIFDPQTRKSARKERSLRFIPVCNSHL